MNIAITRAREKHYPTRTGAWTCQITGDWELWECPDCGYKVQIRWHPFKKIVLNAGANAITPEIADESIRLRKLGEHGKANALLAAAPAHDIRPDGSPISELKIM